MIPFGAPWLLSHGGNRLSSAWESRFPTGIKPAIASKIRLATAIPIPARLQRVGLSDAKIRTLKAIAKAVDRGELDLPALVTKPADEAHAVLTAVHGIGPWTADIYLLFCLGHADAWPAGDLALQEATRLLLALKARPSVKEMGALAEAWRPWRGAAACMLWAYYRAAKQRDGAPIAAAMASNG